MVADTLELWVACRFIERYWRVCGADTLGQEPVEDPSNPWCGTIPVGPTMDVHLDQMVVEEILIPLKDRLLKTLSVKIYENDRSNWFEIYLTVFVLLSNAERMLLHMRSFARTFGHHIRLSRRLRSKGTT